MGKLLHFRASTPLTFSFGNTNNNTAAAGGNTSGTTNNIFGAPAGPAPAAFSFGNPSTTSAPASGSTTPQSKPPAPAFGGGGFSFGAPAATSQTGSTTTSSLFGAQPAPASGTAQPAAATGGFGGFSGFGAAKPTSLPASGTTTPSGTSNTATFGGFGGNAGGGGGFGSTGGGFGSTGGGFGSTGAGGFGAPAAAQQPAQPAQPAASSGGFSFGAPAAPATNTNANANAAPAQASTGGGLFGGGFGTTTAASTPSTNTNATGTGQTAPAPFSLFGAAAKPATPATQTAPSLFGQPAAPAPASTTPAGSGTTTPSGGLFGAQPAQQASGDKPATTPTLNLFGSSNAAAATPAPPSSAMPSLFGNKPADPAPAASGRGGEGTSTPKTAPSSGMFSFAKPAETTAAPTAAPTQAAPSSGGGLFSFAKPAEGQSAAPSTGSTPAPSTPKTQPPAGGLFAGFGAPKPAEPAKEAAATGSSTPQEAPKAGGTLFSLSAPAATTDDAGKKADALTAPKPASASLFGNLGGAAKPTGTAPAIPSMLGTTSATPTSTTTTPSVPAPAAAAKVNAAPEPAPSIVKGKTFNEIVERFEAELEDQVTRFKDQAAEVREWDMILIENSQNIARLYDQTQRAEVERRNIRAALDAIAARQDNLLAQVDEYESVANEVVEVIANNRNVEGGASRPADLQRQDADRLAVRLNDQMQELGGSLSAMIAEMNKLTGNASGSLTFGTEEDGAAGPQDSLSQITAILNAHVSSLEWINSNTETIESKVSVLEKQMQDAQSASNGLGVSTLGRSGVRRQGNTLLGASRYR
ncbi:hypothetical protein QFC22_000698 [Naganishia vaughanmartiniae]|uniref:Uncharacterized protein n=1 Tax=Naganishia vaughanmartiniae TaxID=1424756 RepID=A0ACC2XIT6_9TREE|nr:hypothetical protein QFC22_000698 [Naganishia vaughanmartiniae]